MPRFRYLLFFFCILNFGIKFTAAAPITTDTARNVAENFISHLNSTHIVEIIESAESSGQHVGYLVTLQPRGYILIAGDDIRVPVKAYSLTSIFQALPQTYTLPLLSELEVPVQLMKSSTPLEETNKTYWDFLKQYSPMPALKSYTPDTYLLTSQWGQRYPYNKLNPLSGDTHTLTGCVQTAVAQLMRYHEHPATGNGVFSQSWDGQDLTAVMNRPFNWNLMVADAAAGASYQQDEIAALMRDIGVMNNANYGLSGTSAAFYTDRFKRAFGYAPISTMALSNDDFFTTIRAEIDNLRPVLLSLPNHLTVADGYASDPSGKKIHINMGWEGAHDDYYFLDQTIVAGGISFPPDHSIYYNLKPCEGAECQDPYPLLGTTIPPEIATQLEDMAIYGTVHVRIDGYDRDGDSVSFSASSTCDTLQVSMNNNILTLNSTTPDTYCQVTIFAQSHDGIIAKTFNILTVNEGIYLGSKYDINGQFASQAERDEYTTYLNGETTISGTRGYSNQAFYLWVTDNNGTVVAPTDDTVTHTFSPGYYTVIASLTNTSGSYYSYDISYSNYILSISTNASIEDIANGLGLQQPLCELDISTNGDGSGNVASQPEGIDCGSTCIESFICNSDIFLTSTVDSDSMFTGWSGDCSGIESPLLVHLEENMSCNATYATDADHDQMPDSWEILYGLNTDIDDSHLDADNDGVDNITEYHNGTPPVRLPGDINGDDKISLTDAILSLLIIGGFEPDGVTVDADVNDDDRIGLAETVFCLKKAAGL